jgi:hypothetical protein
MPQVQRFSQLSPSRQAVVRLCQSINHGRIDALHIIGGEPAFTPEPTVLIDVKLDKKKLLGLKLI